MTEGGCVDCMLRSSGYYGGGSSKPNWAGVLINGGAALASIWAGNDLQKYVAGQNARLGQTTQMYPSFGFGYPFIMGAISSALGGGGGFYGAVGGGLGQGGFGCANGMGGNGYGNMVGGPFGYPANYFGTPLL